jgi:protein phosphatase
VTKPVPVCAVTTTGKVRTANQDAVLVGGWLSQAQDARPAVLHVPFDPPVVCAVADGLGGHQAGDLASRMALAEVVALSPQWTDADAIRDGLAAVDRLLSATGARDARTHGMATTVAGVVLGPDRVWWFNVGDSRVYLITDGYAEQASVDDAVVGADGEPTGRVTQVLGGTADAPLAPHVSEIPGAAGTRVLLCSDGLTGPVPRKQLRRLCREPGLEAMVTGLLDAAYAAGATDNVSIIALDLPEILDRPEITAPDG